MRKVAKILCAAIMTIVIQVAMPVFASAATVNGFSYVEMEGMIYLTGYSGTSKEMVVPACVYSSQMGHYIPVRGFSSGIQITNNYVETITFAGNELYGGSFELPYDVFNLPNLKKIVYEASVTYSPEITSNPDYWEMASPFVGVENVTEIVIKDGADVGKMNCSPFYNLETLTIGDYATWFEGQHIMSNTKLKNITVSENNEYLSSEDNVIYNKEKTEIIAYPQAKGETLVELLDSVTSIGNYAFANNKTITEVKFTDKITSIGDCAFLSCEGLKVIEIPKSLEGIGEYAFEKCKALTELYIPGSVKIVSFYAFKDCVNIKELELGEGVQVIDYGVFSGCSSLASVKLPESLLKIHDGVFSGCSSLEGIEFPSGLEYMAIGFSGCTSLKTIKLPPCVKVINNAAFSGCTSLTSIQIPENVTSIENSAFSGCTALAAVAFSDKVEILGDGVFYNCTSLKSISLPDSVTEIGAGVFGGCTALESIHIGAGLENLRTWVYEGNNVYAQSDDYAEKLNGATALKQITVSENNPVFSSIDGNLYSKDKTTIYKYAPGRTAQSFSIPSGVKTIQLYAFENVDALKEVILADTVTAIFNNSFYGCTNLVYTPYNGASYLGTATNKYAALMTVDNKSTITSFEIPSGVAVITGGAFSGAAKLTAITIPKSIKGSGTYAFSSCSALKTINIEDIGLWCMIDFRGGYSCPLQYGKGSLYINSVAVTSLVVPEGVTQISSYAFYNCSSLTDVTFSKTVKDIGLYAFGRCTGLTKIEFAEGLEAIDDLAFDGCSNIASISFPKSLKKIGYRSFDTCTALEKIIIADVDAWCSVEMEEKLTFNYYDLYLKDKLLENIVISKDVSNFVFFRAKSLKSVELSEGVTQIGMQAFSYCTNLEKLIIPKSLKSVGWDAFSDNSKLKGVYITDLQGWCGIDFGDVWSGVSEGNPLVNGADLYLDGKLCEHIVIDFKITGRGSVFNHCKTLKSVVFEGDFKQYLGDDFYGCINLESLTVKDNALSAVGYNSFYGCSSLKTIDLGESVEEIGNRAFYNCTALESIKLSSTIKEIGNDAFYNCKNIKKLDIKTLDAFMKMSYGTSLSNPTYYNPIALYIDGKPATKVVIPETVTRIYATKFNKYNNIEEIYVPESVTNIYSSAFANCTALKKVTILNDGITVVNNAFNGCDLDTVVFTGTEAQLKNLGTQISAAEEKIYLRKVEIYDEDNSYFKDYVLMGTVLDFEEMGYSREGFDTVIYRDAERMIEFSKSAPVNTHLVCYVAYELGKSVSAGVEGELFTITPSNYKTGCEVILALYDGTRLSDVQSKTYEGEAVTFTSDVKYDTAKVMMWVSLEEMIPIDEATIIKPEIVKAIHNDGISVDLNGFNSKCEIYLALYDENNNLVEAQSKPYDGNAVTFTTDTSYDTAKLMAWQKDMKPVADAEEL